MPVKDGVEACRDITVASPDTRALVLTQSTDEDIVAVAVDAGAAGYVQKFSGKEMLFETIDDVRRRRISDPWGIGSKSLRKHASPTQ